MKRHVVKCSHWGECKKKGERCKAHGWNHSHKSTCLEMCDVFQYAECTEVKTVFEKYNGNIQNG